MQIVLHDRGHWHRAMYLQAFEAMNRPVCQSHSASESDLDQIIRSRPDLLIVLGTRQEMLSDMRRCVAVAVEKPVGRHAEELESLAELAGGAARSSAWRSPICRESSGRSVQAARSRIFASGWSTVPHSGMSRGVSPGSCKPQLPVEAP
jgi:hypothetical protein